MFTLIKFEFYKLSKKPIQFQIDLLRAVSHPSLKTRAYGAKSLDFLP